MWIDKIFFIFEAAPFVIESVSHFLNIQSAWSIVGTFAGDLMDFSFCKFGLFLLKEDSLANFERFRTVLLLDWLGDFRF